MTTIECTKGPDLRFQGKVIATVDSFAPGRDEWSILTIYRTEGGSYVAVRERLEDDGEGRPEVVMREASPCKDAAAVLAFYGGATSWMVKQLLAEAGIDHATVVP